MSMGLASAKQPSTQEDIAVTLIAMERAALDRWSAGDPDGFLQITDEDVVYFDPFQETRLNGREALKKLYEGFRGQFRIDHFEMIAPKVVVTAEMAVLTFNFVSDGSEGKMRWNATEVYRLHDDNWRIVHTHWSLTQPKLAP